MSTSQVYYKFIFPDHDKVQTSAITTLLSAHPNNVIAYDELAEKNPAVKQYLDDYLQIPKYFNLRNYWDTQIFQGGGVSLIVSDTPEVMYNKYIKFNSTYNGVTKTVYCGLMVSSGDFYYNYNLPDEVLEKSGLRDKIVRERYHSDFYFKPTEAGANFKLKQDVTLISGTYLNTSSNFDAAGLPIGGPDSVELVTYHAGERIIQLTNGTEKQVFAPSYWRDKLVGYTYGYYGASKFYVNYLGDNGTVYQHSANIYYKDHIDRTGDYMFSSPNYVEGGWYVYKQPFIAPEPDGQYFYKDPGTSEIIPVTRYRYSTNDVHSNKIWGKISGGRIVYLQYDSQLLQYTDTDGNVYPDVVKSTSSGKYYTTHVIPDDFSEIAVTSLRQCECYSDISEDLKKDFIDLEVTKRILYNYSNASSHISGIPRVVEGTDINTVLAYDSPQEYIDRPPMPIRYDLLRAALNNKGPYSDQETVLVMWVADKDPMSSDITSVEDLRNQCNFKQYAIPIAVRCCFTDNSYSNKRFIVSYPYKYGDISTLGKRYYTGSCGKYNPNEFKDILYLQDLIRYSNDYIVAYQNTGFVSKSQFDIQSYLLKNYYSSFKCLYVRKTYTTNASLYPAVQNYYIKMPNDQYSVDTTITPVHIKGSVSSLSDYDTLLKPSLHITRSKFVNDFINKSSPVESDWNEDGSRVTCRFYNANTHSIVDRKLNSISDSFFITLFKKSDIPSLIEDTGTLILDPSFRSKLQDITGDTSAGDDVFISSFGINLTHSWSNADRLIYSIGGHDANFYPLDILNDYISIKHADNTVTHYGPSHNKVLIGLKNVYDYDCNDSHHFKYIDGQYKLVRAHSGTDIIMRSDMKTSVMGNSSIVNSSGKIIDNETTEYTGGILHNYYGYKYVYNPVMLGYTQVDESVEYTIYALPYSG